MTRMGSTDHDDGRGDLRELSVNAELESIVYAYEVWQNGLGWHAVRRDVPLEVHTGSREEMRTKLVGIGKFGIPGGRPEQR